MGGGGVGAGNCAAGGGVYLMWDVSFRCIRAFWLVEVKLRKGRLRRLG